MPILSIQVIPKKTRRHGKISLPVPVDTMLEDVAMDSTVHPYSNHHPLAATLDKLIKHHGQVGQDEATNVKSKKLGRMS